MDRTGRLTLALAVASLGILPLCAQTASLCDSVAAGLRASSSLVNGTAQDDPLLILASGRAPIVDRVRQPTHSLIGANPDDVAALLKTFNASFSPSAPLLTAVTALITGGENEVFALRQGDLGMVVNTAGSASCQYFVFFRSAPGREAQRVREPFDREQMNFCYNDSGFLARVNGAAAFVEYTRPLIERRYAWRVFPWQNGDWGHTCSVTADFETQYEVVDVFVPDDGPLKDAGIRGVAADIARRRDAAKDDPYRSFNAGVPARALETILAIRERDGSARPRELPTFNRRAVSQLDASYQTVQDGELLPIVIDGRPFLLYLAHASVGWRTYPDWLMIFYSLEADAVAPVGSAIVKAHGGALKSLRVGP